LKKKLGVSYDYLIDGDEKVLTQQALKNELAAIRQENERLKKIVDKLIK
jgi:hypothetical protein